MPLVNAQLSPKLLLGNPVCETKENGFLCLKGGHIIRNCPSRFKCFKCGGRHNISICKPNPVRRDSGNRNFIPATQTFTPETSSQSTNFVSAHPRSQTLLQTGPSANFRRNGNQKVSSMSFIRPRIAENLHYISILLEFGWARSRGCNFKNSVWIRTFRAQTITKSELLHEKWLSQFKSLLKSNRGLGLSLNRTVVH